MILKGEFPYYNLDGNHDMITAGGFDVFYFRQRQDPPYSLNVRDGAGNATSRVGSVEPFSTFKAAVSFDQSRMTIAVGGNTDTSPSDGSLASNLDDITLNKSNLLPIESLLYTPRALPATPADRSAGDPVSLETLTS
jgi:hypothetical protein